MGEGNPFIGQSAWNVKEFGVTNLKHTNDQWTDSPERLTDYTTLLQHLLPLGIDIEAPSQPSQVSLGTELDDETNQDSKLPYETSHRSHQKPGYRQVSVRIPYYRKLTLHEINANR